MLKRKHDVQSSNPDADGACGPPPSRPRCSWLRPAPAPAPLPRPASAPRPSAATASAPATLPPGAFTSKLRIPRFTGSCPATTAPSASGDTVVIPLHILTPSAVISQLFVGVCLNGHGPYPFIIDTGSMRTYVDVALASHLNLISASVATRLGTATCDGPEQQAAARLSVGPYLFGQDREVVIAALASPSAPLMGILGVGRAQPPRHRPHRLPRPDAHGAGADGPGGRGTAALAPLFSRHRAPDRAAPQRRPPADPGDRRERPGGAATRHRRPGHTPPYTPAFARQARLAKASSVTTQTYAGLGGAPGR